MRICCFSVAIAVLACSWAGAARAQETTEAANTEAIGVDSALPEVVVTTSAPIAKPAKKKTKPVNAGPSGLSASSAPAVAEAAPKPDLIPLPGTLITDVDSFVPVTVAPAREFLGDGGATLTDTLQSKPGIAGTTFAPGANRPIIRGLDSYRVRVQEDGIGVHDVSALSEDHAIPIDPLSVSQVEVVRGPATLRYGSQAIGGVVNATNNRIPTGIPLGGISARTLGGFSSVDEGWDGAFGVTAGSGNFAFHADGFKRDADDYDTPHGTQLNSFVESEGGSVGGSVVGTDGYIGIAYVRFDSLYGIPGEEGAEEAPRIDLVQDKIMSKGEWRVRSNGIEALRYWFGASDYEHKEVAFEDGASFVGSQFVNRQWEGRAELEHSPIATLFGELRGAVGVQYNDRDVRGTSFEGDNLLEPATTEMIAVFIYEELQASENLRLMGSFRYENAHLDGTGLILTSPNTGDIVSNAPTFNPLSGSLGLMYDLPADVVFRLTGHHVERAPADGELYSKGVHEATGTFEIGDPNLDVEKANSIELGFERALGAFRFDTSAYYTEFDGFIFKALTGVECGETLDSCGDEDELDQVVFGQRDATFYGLELAAELDVAPIWNGIWGITGRYDFVRAKFSNGENVPRMPPHRLGGGLFYRGTQWVAQFNALHAFRQNEPGPNETPTSSYTLLNAELSYTTTLDVAAGTATEATIGIRGSNLLDDDVRNSASFKKDEVLQPGASVRVFGSVKLN